MHNPINGWINQWIIQSFWTPVAYSVPGERENGNSGDGMVWSKRQGTRGIACGAPGRHSQRGLGEAEGVSQAQSCLHGSEAAEEQSRSVRGSAVRSSEGSVTKMERPRVCSGGQPARREPRVQVGGPEWWVPVERPAGCRPREDLSPPRQEGSLVEGLHSYPGCQGKPPFSSLRIFHG